MYMWISVRKNYALNFKNIFRILISLIIILIIIHQIRHLDKNKSHIGPRIEDNHFPIVRPPSIQWDQWRFDKRGTVRIYNWAWRGSDWSDLIKNMSVCLATQTSIDRMHSIAEVAGNWLGPISLAVYISTVKELAILNYFVQYMEICDPVFSKIVSIHVAINSSSPDIRNMHSFNSINLTHEQLTTYPCGKPKEFISKMMSELMPEGIDPNILYPQNHMRNIARPACGTPWVMVTDVDIIPSQNSAKHLHDFYMKEQEGSKCYKCAFVIPTFELETSLPYPKTKIELISHVVKSRARQFHVMIFPEGHSATNYSVWMSTNLLDEEIKVSHLSSVEKSIHYEPYYISSNDIPTHRERYVGFGANRISQVFEAKLNGWVFKVLTPIFAIHRGLQKLENRLPSRNLQLEVNKLMLKEFVLEMLQMKNITTGAN